jgi:translation initiation factor 2B subunit (eIF-2B alpha/beta/delta family)
LLQERDEQERLRRDAAQDAGNWRNAYEQLVKSRPMEVSLRNEVTTLKQQLRDATIESNRNLKDCDRLQGLLAQAQTMLRRAPKTIKLKLYEDDDADTRQPADFAGYDPEVAV